MSDLAPKARPLILIIDDILDNIEVAAEALSAEYAIQFATSGPEGLALIHVKQPDLILLDVMMPEMDGYEVFAALKRDPQTATIPVIFVTAQNDTQNELKALAAGAVDFISKPIIPEIVRARVHTQLTLHQQALELRQLNSALESKVQERTRQVQILNAALEERAHQAETANHAKTLFLGNMSHELRTPMSAILGFSDLLLKTTTEPSAIQKLSNIRKAAKHLSSTIDEILYFTRIESDEWVQDSTDFDLADLMRHVDEVIEERALAKNLAYSSRIDADIPLHLLGDVVKLEQVLINLASNAIKFTREGAVSIEAQLLKLSIDTIEVRFAVTDTGIGIEASKLEQIFHPFEQADMELTRQYGGVGLGLSINRKLVEMMGGQMGVDTVVGKGSRFWVHLKLKRSQAIAPPRSHLSPLQSLQAMTAKPSILLVDDDYFNQSIFSELLRQAGLSVDVANDGAEALAKAASGRYALILMDVQMPIMNGLDATRAIRQLADYQQTPIVAISANAFDEDRQRCFEAGMNAFLAKPLMPELLYNELAKWLI